MIVVMLIAFAVLAVLEVPGLIKKKQWRELVSYSVLMLIAIAISILYYKRIEIPNPVKNTQFYVKNMVEYLFNFSYD
ncbi:MAG: hypothetical protein VB064_06050 [Oscillospiraceae bacterium]|nr:hypothetical protein [Oscillospiraceae bacterium]